jgi:hypothetical protein
LESRDQRTSTLWHTADAYHVDDTKLFVTLQNADLETLALEMQSTAQFWEQLLFTTGGALALEKCFLWPWIGFLKMTLTAHQGKECQSSGCTSPLHLAELTPHILGFISATHPSEGPQNLGMMLAPDGNNIHYCTALCTKGSTLSRNIVASPLSQPWQGLHSIFPDALVLHEICPGGNNFLGC